MPLRKLVAGNWKMNGLAASAAMLDDLAAAQPGARLRRADLPARDAWSPGWRGGPFPSAARTATGRPPGAHTGDISAEMLADAGAGRGDRRPFRAPRRPRRDRRAGRRARPPPPGARASSPSSASARPRPSATPAGRSTGSARSSRARSPTAPPPERLVVAYEPVWAIGTGRTPSLSEIAEVHRFMRERLVGALRRGRRRGRSACSTAAR